MRWTLTFKQENESGSIKIKSNLSILEEFDHSYWDLVADFVFFCKSQQFLDIVKNFSKTMRFQSNFLKSKSEKHYITTKTDLINSYVKNEF